MVKWNTKILNKTDDLSFLLEILGERSRDLSPGTPLANKVRNVTKALESLFEASDEDILRTVKEMRGDYMEIDELLYDIRRQITKKTGTGQADVFLKNGRIVHIAYEERTRRFVLNLLFSEKEVEAIGRTVLSTKTVFNVAKYELDALREPLKEFFEDDRFLLTAKWNVILSDNRTQFRKGQSYVAREDHNGYYVECEEGEVFIEDIGNFNKSA